MTGVIAIMVVMPVMIVPVVPVVIVLSPGRPPMVRPIMALVSLEILGGARRSLLDDLLQFAAVEPDATTLRTDVELDAAALDGLHRGVAVGAKQEGHWNHRGSDARAIASTPSPNPRTNVETNGLAKSD